jgi:hypothetical protein
MLLKKFRSECCRDIVLQVPYDLQKKQLRDVSDRNTIYRGRSNQIKI